MKQSLQFTRSFAVDRSGRQWLCFYSRSRSLFDTCGREVITTVPAGQSDRHGTAVTVSDHRLAARLIIRITQVAVF